LNLCSLVHDITEISSWLPYSIALESCYLSNYPYRICRTAQFLNVLAQVDAMCCNVNDCQVKLQGIEGLLQLESRFQPYDITSKNRKIDADSELCRELEQMTLERVSDIKFIFQSVLVNLQNLTSLF
jgi:hypothetical protein